MLPDWSVYNWTKVGEKRHNRKKLKLDIFDDFQTLCCTLVFPPLPFYGLQNSAAKPNQIRHNFSNHFYRQNAFGKKLQGDAKIGVVEGVRNFFRKVCQVFRALQ